VLDAKERRAFEELGGTFESPLAWYRRRSRIIGV